MPCCYEIGDTLSSLWKARLTPQEPGTCRKSAKQTRHRRVIHRYFYNTGYTRLRKATVFCIVTNIGHLSLTPGSFFVELVKILRGMNNLAHMPVRGVSPGHWLIWKNNLDYQKKAIKIVNLQRVTFLPPRCRLWILFQGNERNAAGKHDRCFGKKDILSWWSSTT